MSVYILSNGTPVGFADELDFASATISGKVATVGSGDVGCRVYRTTDQSLSDGANTSISFNAERYDTDSMWSSGTQITIKTAGKYLITGCVSFAANATGIRQVGILINSTTVPVLLQNQNPNATNNIPISVATIWSCAVNDTIELRAYQNSGGALNAVAATEFAPELAVQLLA